ncbi:MAG: hypothetical protein K6F72_03730 [Bacteroidales bacterium]|nr:hypothetical protein [Bacteroidales bacterium]
MKKIYSLMICLVGTLLLSSCLSLAPTTITRHASLDGYKYFYVTPTSERSAVTGGTYGHNGNVYGSTRSNSVNPADLIAGYLMNRGYVRVPEVKQQNAAQTMIINYGDGNSREGFWEERAVEVTIQVLNGETNELICVCRADDKGGDEARAITRAINKCLDEIFLQRP